MKRTNIVLDDALLDEAVRLSGERTYARTIERALEEMVRRLKARAVFELAGSGAWSGDIGLMRSDAGSQSFQAIASSGEAAPERKGVYRPRQRKPRVPR
jgi:Bacterial antitoxin of type II TA system, VapB